MSGRDDCCLVSGYRISPELFGKGYPNGGGPCACTAACCADGVYADVRERERILAHQDLVKRHMDETQTTDASRWFEPLEQEDSDFPSGRCVATEVVNGKCVFLNKSGRCSLQVAATAEGMDKWALKPLFCILYPIDVSDGNVNFDELLQDDQPCCSVGDKFATPLFEACREELTHLLGEDGFHAMAEYYRQHSGSLHEHTPDRNQ